jgi:hypothetical protein
LRQLRKNSIAIFAASFLPIDLMLNHFLLTLSLLANTAPAPASDLHSTNTEITSGSSLSGFSSETFEDSLVHLYDAIELQQKGLSYDAFRFAMIGFYTLKDDGRLNDKNIISIIDFTKASTEERFYTIDLDRRQIIYHSLVSHGKNTGENIAKSFSNVVHSNQSSLGFYITGETYVGSKGYSLKLDGIENGVNDKMRERAVVMHEADYVSDYWIRKFGRLGRSQGCPALPKAISREVINTIKNKTVVFAYFNDDHYLSSSNYLNVDALLARIPNESVLSTPVVPIDAAELLEVETDASINLLKP